jgi:hypothetical protein
MEKVRLVPAQLYPKCTAVFTLGEQKYEGLRIPYNPMFELCHNLVLRNDEPNLETVLKLLSGQEEDVKLSEVETIKKIAKQHFGVELEVDSHNLSRTLISILAKESIDVNLLDSLRADTICDAIELAYNKSHHVEHEKVNANLGKFLETSNKNDSEKNKIKTTTTLKPKYKYREKVEEDEEIRDRRDNQRNPKSRKESHNEDTYEQSNRKDGKKGEKRHYVEKKEAQESKALGMGEFEDFREKRSKLRDEQIEKKFGKELAPSAGLDQEPKQKAQRSSRIPDEPRSFDDKKHFDPRRQMRGRQTEGTGDDKEPRDDRIMLGVHGETPLRWREYNRPVRIPAV